MVYFSLSGPKDVEDGQWFYDYRPEWIGASDIATPNGTNEIEQIYEIRFKIYCFYQNIHKHPPRLCFLKIFS